MIERPRVRVRVLWRVWQRTGFRGADGAPAAVRPIAEPSPGSGLPELVAELRRAACDPRSDDVRGPTTAGGRGHRSRPTDRLK